MNRAIFFIIFLCLSITSCVVIIPSFSITMENKSSHLLSDPFLQLPTSNSIKVVWFSDFPSKRSYIKYGRQLEKEIDATTTQLSRMREDQDSFVNQKYTQVKFRNIWRHEVTVNDLTPNQRLPYQAVSINNGELISSKIFSLASNPTPEKPLKILLTSDHQLMPMTAANLQKVVETIGQLDAVFFAGDLVNVPDRASEWFDDNRGGAFFPCLQGKAHYQLGKTIYQGGEIIQHAPIFTTIGNHEVMGRFSMTQSLKYQFNDSIPRYIAEKIYPQEDIKNNSFNSDSYEEIFSLPESELGEKKYYAVTFGNIRLVVLNITNMWRNPSTKVDVKGKYQESIEDLDFPERWGYGQHIFEPITKDSKQYNWLKDELASDAFNKAEYKIVMFHHPPHSLGLNIVPPYTDPQQFIEKDHKGKITSIKYKYSQEKDYIIQYLIPLLEDAGVQLVYYGHSHLWNRFTGSSGMHFLESSNVGNSYGAYWKERKRRVPDDNADYSEWGNPNGLKPILPNIAPIKDETGNELPYIASNDITVFTVLDTEKKTVSSYRFDTRKQCSQVIKFDEFAI